MNSKGFVVFLKMNFSIEFVSSLIPETLLLLNLFMMTLITNIFVFFTILKVNFMENDTAASVMDTGYKRQTLNKLQLKIGKEYQFLSSFENLISVNVDDNYIHIGKNMAEDLIQFFKDEIKTNNYRIFKLSSEV